jgi:hypothetical protein
MALRQHLEDRCLAAQGRREWQEEVAPWPGLGSTGEEERGEKLIGEAHMSTTEERDDHVATKHYPKRKMYSTAYGERQAGVVEWAD